MSDNVEDTNEVTNRKELAGLVLDIIAIFGMENSKRKYEEFVDWANIEYPDGGYQPYDTIITYNEFKEEQDRRADAMKRFRERMSKND